MLAPIIATSGLFTFGWTGSVLVEIARRSQAAKTVVLRARQHGRRTPRCRTSRRRCIYLVCGPLPEAEDRRAAGAADRSIGLDARALDHRPPALLFGGIKAGPRPPCCRSAWQRRFPAASPPPARAPPWPPRPTACSACACARLAGASRPYHCLISKPGKPCSATVGTSGNRARRWVPAGGDAAQFAGLKAGKLRCIATGSTQRLAQLPDVPTVAEQGFPGFEMTQWYGLLAPASLPAAHAERLSALAAKAVREPAAAKCRKRRRHSHRQHGPGVCSLHCRRTEALAASDRARTHQARLSGSAAPAGLRSSTLGQGAARRVNATAAVCPAACRPAACAGEREAPASSPPGSGARSRPARCRSSRR